MPVDVAAVSKVEPFTIGKIELPLLSLAILVSKQSLFCFTQENKLASIVADGVTLLEYDIIWIVSPKKNHRPISKMTQTVLIFGNK